MSLSKQGRIRGERIENPLLRRSGFFIAALALGTVFLMPTSPVLAGLFGGSKADVATQIAAVSGTYPREITYGSQIENISEFIVQDATRPKYPCDGRTRWVTLESI
jgi:hypothetical protein